MEPDYTISDKVVQYIFIECENPWYIRILNFHHFIQFHLTVVNRSQNRSQKAVRYSGIEQTFELPHLQLV